MLSLVYLPIDRLHADPRNPRKHPHQQLRKLAASIEASGFVTPVLIDGAGAIVAGHARVLAAQQRGMTEVPTICLDHLSKAQIRAFMIAENRLAELAERDERLLGEALRDLAEVDLDFSIEATGFDMTEIDLRIDALDEDGAKTAGDAADKMPPHKSGPSITQTGDLWLLGSHRVLCGSALNEDNYPVLLEGRKVATVITDPPYNVKIAGNVSGLGAVQHREFAMASGEMSQAELVTFLQQVMNLMAANSTDGALHYVFMDWRHIHEITLAGQAAYDVLINVCVWAKDQAGMGSFYRSQHELAFVFRSGHTQHRNNVQLVRHGRNRSNVWRYPGVNSFAGRSGEESNLLHLHPTVNPVAILRDAVLDCTVRRDWVLDPFLGSGSTLIAAEKCGRICAGMELDPLHVDTIVRRWQRLTKQRAHLSASGETFDAVAVRRHDDRAPKLLTYDGGGIR
jgi:DNA modification methylase